MPILFNFVTDLLCKNVLPVVSECPRLVPSPLFPDLVFTALDPQISPVDVTTLRLLVFRKRQRYRLVQDFWSAPLQIPTFLGFPLIWAPHLNVTIGRISHKVPQFPQSHRVSPPWLFHSRAACFFFFFFFPSINICISPHHFASLSSMIPSLESSPSGFVFALIFSTSLPSEHPRQLILASPVWAPPPPLFPSRSLVIPTDIRFLWFLPLFYPLPLANISMEVLFVCGTT